MAKGDVRTALAQRWLAQRWLDVGSALSELGLTWGSDAFARQHDAPHCTKRCGSNPLVGVSYLPRQCRAFTPEYSEPEYGSGTANEDEQS
jgi:hypothetical protein